MKTAEMDWKMYWLVGIVLVGTALSVNSEVHRLSYIYTALSKPSGLPGIHDFTAMGLLDDRMIDYFDSTRNEKIPKQKWMEDNLRADYWEKGTKSRKSKHQWFKVNLDILMKRLRQNDTDIHVLQWQHGCEGHVDPTTNEMTFSSGKDMYSYDGQRFLYFDDANEIWVAASPAATETKRKWDDVQVLKDYTKGYLEKECMMWLKEFMGFEQRQLKLDSEALPPEIYVFAKNAKVKENVVLTCFATGFWPKEIDLLIKRDGRILTKDDGVHSTDSRPNGDGTYQRKDWVEILRSDKSRYSCEVIHAASGVRKEQDWNHEICSHPGEGGGGGVGVGPVVGGVIGALALIAGVVVVALWRTGKIGGSKRGGQAYVKVNVAGIQQQQQPPAVKVDVPDSKDPQDTGSTGFTGFSGYTGSTGSTGSSDANNSGSKDPQDSGSTGSSGYNSTEGGETSPSTSTS